MPNALPEIAEVVVVADARDRIEQRRDRLREVLVDVGVRPEAGAWVRAALGPGRRIWIRRGYVIGRDWTIQSFPSRSIVHSMSCGQPKVRFDVERESRELGDLIVVQQQRLARPAHRPAPPGERPACQSRLRFSRPVDRDPARVHRARHQRLAHPAAVLDEHLLRIGRRDREQHTREHAPPPAAGR